MNIAKDIEKLEKEYLLTKKREEKKLEEKLNRQFRKRISLLKRKAFLCDSNDESGYFFDEKERNAKFVYSSMGAAKGCRKWSERKDWSYASIENYYPRQVYVDAGWGDDDEFAYVHVKDYFKVCPICGKMYKIAEEILGESPRWRGRCDISEIKTARTFIPDGFDTEHGILRFEKPSKELVRK